MASSSTAFEKWITTIPELAGGASSPRVQSLFSDIVRQKATNPAAYHANVSWWRRTLHDLLSSGAQLSTDHLVVNLDEDLLQDFTRVVNRKPLALVSVVVGVHRL